MNQVALFIRVMLARAYPRVIMVRRAPMWVIQETVLPLLTVMAFAYLYQELRAPPHYLGFVILGGAMTAFWLNVLWSMGAQLYWERDSGNLEIYIAAPAPMMGILAGMALGGMLLTGVRAVTILTAGFFIFGVRFDLTDWPWIGLTFLLTMLALYGLGMMFSSLFLLWGRGAYHAVNLLQEPVFVLSGVNFPVKILPSAVATAAAVIPLTAGMDALRQLLFPQTGEGLYPLWLELSLLAGLSCVFLVGAYFALSYIEWRARVEGRLTVRWQ